MAKITIFKLSSAALLLLAVLMAPTSAFAQKGSRLCGWTASTPQGAVIGLLYEAREKDASYSKQCDEVIDKMNDAIKKDAKLSQLSWTKVHKATCESVGKYFVSSDHPNEDMCDYMGAKGKGYNVMKAGPKTTYTQL